MILRPIKHGKKCAIVLSDQILEAAGLSKSGQIQLIINPSGGLLLQAAEEPDNAKTNLELMEELGLLGTIEDRQVTSLNRKKFIKKYFRKRHGKNS